MTLSAERKALAGNTSDATGATNPFDRTKIYIAYGYGLSGAGVKVGVVDDGFNLVDGKPVHNEFTGSGKIVVLSSSATLDGSTPAKPDDGAHGAHVSGLIAADRNGTTMMGVAYDAQLYLGMVPDDANGFAKLFDEYRTSGVAVSSNSYGIPIKGDETSPWKPVKTSKTYEVTAANAIAYRDANGLSNAQMMANIHSAVSTPGEWTTAIGAMKAYQDAGGVIVWANSNYGPNDKGLDGPDLVAALPLAYTELRGAWITVVNASSAGLLAKVNGDGWLESATKKENNIALNSAPCGLAAAFCLSMDGAAMWSASSKGVGTYEGQTGTSQGTPMVAGMIALLRQAFPTASAADLTARLMFTADNRFFANGSTVSTVTTVSYTNANGTITGKVSDIWGHGFPDMQAALDPVGAVTVRTRSGTVVPLQALSGTLQVGGALGTGSGLANTVYLYNDVLNGVFANRLGTQIAASTDTRLIDTLANSQIDLASRAAETTSGLSVRFGMVPVAEAGGDRGRLGTQFALSQRVGERASIAFGYGFSPDTTLGFGPRHAGLRSASISDRAMGIPFLGFGNPWTRRWAAMGFTGGIVRGSVATFSGGISQQQARLRSPLANRGRTDGVVVDAVIGTPGARFAFNVSAGQTRERDGFLGSQASNGLFAAGATSRFARVAFTTRLAGPIGVQGNYVTALTRVAPQAQGLISGFSTLRSDAASLALVGDGLLGKGTLLTVGVAQPLRVASGRGALALPQGVRLNAPGDYTYLYGDDTIRLTPEGRELDYTVEFSKRLGGSTTLRFAGMAMRQPGHDAAAGMGLAGLVGLKTAF